MDNLETFLRGRKLTKAEVAREIKHDESALGKKLRHIRPIRLQDVVDIWLLLRRRGWNVRLGTVAERAAVGMEKYDAEFKDREGRN